MTSEEAIDAIKALDAAGAQAFITCESGGLHGSRGPCVLVRFSTMIQAHTFHRALIQCGEAARHMEAMEQADNERKP